MHLHTQVKDFKINFLKIDIKINNWDFRPKDHYQPKRTVRKTLKTQTQTFISIINYYLPVNFSNSAINAALEKLSSGSSFLIRENSTRSTSASTALTLKTIGILLAREQLGFNTCEPVLSPYLKHIKNRAMRAVTAKMQGWKLLGLGPLQFELG